MAVAGSRHDQLIGRAHSGIAGRGGPSGGWWARVPRYWSVRAVRNRFPVAPSSTTHADDGGLVAMFSHRDGGPLCPDGAGRAGEPVEVDYPLR